MTAPRLMPVLALLALLAAVTAATAQEEGITVRTDASGRISLMAEGRLIGIIELSLHAPEWTHVPQSRARAQAEVVTEDDAPVLTYRGTLPLPNAEGGVSFVQAVRPAENGFFLDYDITCEQAVTLNAIQVSLLMPEALYRGSQAEITLAGDTIRQLPLPEEQAEDFVLLQANTNSVGVAPEGAPALAIGAKEGADTRIMDLRRWNQPYFEVRYPLVYADQGQEIAAGTTYKAPLALGFEVPVTIERLAMEGPPPAPAATGVEGGGEAAP